MYLTSGVEWRLTHRKFPLRLVMRGGLHRRTEELGRVWYRQRCNCTSSSSWRDGSNDSKIWDMGRQQP